ncbi:MAG: hypothetical protein JRG80_20015 [Deltaproteobacteria bacterium]|nr:hypothetical protein [Deltaproteobacteria bacterium]
MSRADFEAQLKPDEIELVEGEIAISSWYSIETYGRMLKLLGGTSSNPSEWLIESGRRSARRVIDLGIYAQLEDLTEANWENRIGRILVTLSAGFFSCGRWQWQGMDANSFEIEVLDAHDYSLELVLRTQGFVEMLATRAAGHPVALSHERSPDGGRILYRAAG